MVKVLKKNVLRLIISSDAAPRQYFPLSNILLSVVKYLLLPARLRTSGKTEELLQKQGRKERSIAMERLKTKEIWTREKEAKNKDWEDVIGAAWDGRTCWHFQVILQSHAGASYPDVASSWCIAKRTLNNRSWVSKWEIHLGLKHATRLIAALRHSELIGTSRKVPKLTSSRGFKSI